MPVFSHIITPPAPRRVARSAICSYRAASTFLSPCLLLLAVSKVSRGGTPIRIMQLQPSLQRTYICTHVYVYPRGRIASCSLVFVFGLTQPHNSSIIAFSFSRSPILRSWFISFFNFSSRWPVRLADGLV
ncbi:hypothetical protein BD311DRAFT_340817 [Dichomitus squalens]|uniref:Uncharacterized protein n=1 Tax=Dichomitus squalens TaxID=114155 RepID=A0A4V2K1T8_9APHY|nr:hypothetical protein BD311DRAFT_340817 [Dichomitus squalens]